MTIDLKRPTYDAYLAMPEMKQRYSIIDGELVMAVSPTLPHQTIVIEIALKLTPFVREHQLGRVFVAPLDIVIRRKPSRTRQPDVMFNGWERRFIIGPQVVEDIFPEFDFGRS
jgi:Uma2 family endonuclease